MKKFLLTMAVMAMLSPTAFACEETCVSRDEATVETPAEDLCPAGHSGLVPMNPSVMRHALLMSYVNRLEELGGTYVEGMNRFEVMKAIFEIEKAL